MSAAFADWLKAVSSLPVPHDIDAPRAPTEGTYLKINEVSAALASDPIDLVDGLVAPVDAEDFAVLIPNSVPPKLAADLLRNVAALIEPLQSVGDLMGTGDLSLDAFVKAARENPRSDPFEALK